jgi:arginine deiminase
MARVDSEVGRLRTVMLHRPGDELRRLTPRNSADLLFDGIPWVERAQVEHDGFAAALAGHGVEVLEFQDLLGEALGVAAAREQVVEHTADDPRLGPTLSAQVRGYLDDLSSQELAAMLIGGLAHSELPGGHGLVWSLSREHDFVVPPLPNVLFTRDSSVWIGEHVAVTSPSLPARRREAWLTDAIFRHHPRFARTPVVYSPDDPWLEGGDVLLLAPGVVAVGIGQRTQAAAAETLAARLFARGLARVVLGVPIAQERATMHLDTVCTMVDRDAVVMFPPVADTLRAWRITPAGDTSGDATEVAVEGPLPFLSAAAEAMGIDRLRVIDTGLDPVTAVREQWDDGNNTLAIGPRLCVAYERNVVTNARLAAWGVEVVAIAGSELGSGRGGPRCMSCPLDREPLAD